MLLLDSMGLKKPKYLPQAYKQYPGSWVKKGSAIGTVEAIYGKGLHFTGCW